MLLPNLPPPVEGIRHEEAGVQIFVNQRALGTGTLYIAESRVSWSKDGANEGMSIEYPHIAIHAISRDTNHFPHPCLYFMIDAPVEDLQLQAENENGHNADSENEDEDEDGEGMTEMRFVPRAIQALEPMYKALNDCQLLHPDQEDHPSDEEVGEFPEEYEGEYDTAENGHHIPGSYENNMENELEEEDSNEVPMETGQFDDAEM